MDLNRILHPIWLAKGSHQPGFGNGCAMSAGVATARTCFVTAQRDAPKKSKLSIDNRKITG